MVSARSWAFPKSWTPPDSVAKIGIMTQAPGAFFCFGLLMAGCVWLEGKLDARIERKSCCDLDNLKKEAE